MKRLQSFVLMALLAAPALAQLSWVQEKSQPIASAPRTPPHAMSRPSPGGVADGVYRNPSFGFSYKLPYGWVDRTADMQDQSPEASKSRVLLAVFERPPQASGDTVNSAVVVAAEPIAAGTNTAAGYLESLSALTTGKGFEVKEGPSELSVGTAKLVRGDFSKARGTLTMYQTLLVMLEKGYAVSFTFIGGSEDEVNELIEKLSFVVRKPQH